MAKADRVSVALNTSCVSQTIALVILSFIWQVSYDRYSILTGPQHVIWSGSGAGRRGCKGMKNFSRRNVANIVGQQQRNFWFLEALKTSHHHLKKDTIILSNTNSNTKPLSEKDYWQHRYVCSKLTKSCIFFDLLLI